MHGFLVLYSEMLCYAVSDDGVAPRRACGFACGLGDCVGPLVRLVLSELGATLCDSVLRWVWEFFGMNSVSRDRALSLSLIWDDMSEWMLGCLGGDEIILSC